MATIYTQAGEELVVDLIDDTASGAATHYIGWGTGAGTAAKGDTTLFTEASETRVAATKSQPAVDKNQWLGTLTADAAKTITNGGVLSALTVGTLIVHGDFAGVALLLGDKIEFTVTLEQT